MVTTTLYLPRSSKVTESVSGFTRFRGRPEEKFDAGVPIHVSGNNTASRARARLDA